MRNANKSKEQLMDELIKLRKRNKELEKIDADLRRSDQAVQEERGRLRTLIDNLPESIYFKDRESRFLIANIEVTKRMGAASPDELIGKTDFDFVEKERAEKYYADEQQVIKTGKPLINHEEISRDTSGKTIWILTSKVPLRDKSGNIIGIVGMGRNITERKQFQEQQKKLMAELKKAIEKIKTLRGLLPICASCKRIRDDQGSWQQVESYIRDHSGAIFSHSLCPDCAKKIYPDLDLDTDHE